MQAAVGGELIFAESLHHGHGLRTHRVERGEGADEKQDDKRGGDQPARREIELRAVKGNGVVQWRWFHDGDRNTLAGTPEANECGTLGNYRPFGTWKISRWLEWPVWRWSVRGICPAAVIS